MRSHGGRDWTARRLAAAAARGLCILLVSAAGSGCGTLFSKAPAPYARYRPSTGLRPMGIASVSSTAATNAAAAERMGAKTLSADEPAGAGRRLRPGDRIALRLSGIRSPIEVADVLDEKGEITLEMLGSISLAGLTATEAERKIQNEYIAREIYKSISVSVVVEQASYYVQGEVRQPGRFVLTESLTLIQAIASAGGYTDFAKPSKVRIIRGDDVLYYDAARIGRRLDKDPLIRRGDTIIVERTSL